MKTRDVVLSAVLSLATAVPLLGQTPPRLIEIQFTQGEPTNRVTYGDVTVELKFDKVMDQTVDPVMHYGLNDTYTLTLPVSGRWENPNLWQGRFTVTNNVPSTGDGEYFFRIHGARDTGGVEMDTTFSKNVNKTTLFVCRTGELLVSTGLLNFGTISAGSARTLSFTLTNTSCAELRITSLQTSDPAFEPLNVPSNLTLAPNEQYKVNVRLFSTNRAVYDDSLTIRSNARINNNTIIRLKGTVRGPRIVLSPTVINFGRVGIDSTVTATVRVTNVKAANAALTDTLFVNNIVATDAAAFKAIPNRLTVAPGDTKQVTVQFTPREIRSYNNHRMIFQSNDLVNPSASVVLNGDASDYSPPPPPTTITGQWSGYNGYIRSDSLRICWSAINDPSGVAYVYWRFTTQPSPPQNGTDTTQFGGRYAVDGQTCAWLPLAGRISSGRWYCYVWFEDSRGNSGYAQARLLSFVYDTTPPGPPTLLLRTVPINQWFNRFTPFGLTLSIPLDTTRGVRDAAEVRWKYKSPPQNASDYNLRTFIGSTRRDSLTITIPFDADSLCGSDTLYVWLADSAGNSNSENITKVPYRFDICSPVITRIQPADRNIALFGEAYIDTLDIQDHSGIDTVWAEYRFAGAMVSEPPRRVTRIGNSSRYVMEIPKSGVTRRGLEYRVIASDLLRNQGVGPQRESGCSEEGWFPVRIRVEGEGAFRVDSDGRPVTLVAGDDETTYQLISVPYELDSNRVSQVFGDDLGPADPKVWRLFDYLPQNPDTARWLEGDNARPVEPGRAFFIITRKEGIVIDSGPGQTRRTVCPETLRVYEGWNLIATPFNFPVHREALSLINAGSEVSLRSFERGWDIIDYMEPWKGYALYVRRHPDSQETPMYLVVQPKAMSGRASKSAEAPDVLADGEWLVRIIGQGGNFTDRDNWLGVRAAALPGYDALELAEPPVLGRYVKIAFPHPEWQEPASEFSTDLRPLASGDGTWHVNVESNMPNTTLTLRFEIQGDFPADRHAFLIDPVAGVAADIRQQPMYHLRTGEQGLHRTLKVVVGTKKFAQAEAEDIALMPQRFEVLPNYPNPFNPGTTIRYTLDEPATVNVVIYNQLGQVVRTLVQRQQQPAGYHALIWDGRDDAGRPLASGVYVLQVRAGQRALSHKMLMLK